MLNTAIAKRNIKRMAEKARRSDVRFRPHVKTHQSATIGEWFRAEGVSGITVSSLDMAEYFAENGWDDITVAFPANWLQIDLIKRLAERIRLNLLVESTESVEFLAQNLPSPVNI
jgi:D-serine deaminase-like pyridoxal phosphate-dependent protein